MPKDKVWEIFMEGLNGFTGDYLAEGRAEQTDVQRDVPMHAKEE